MTGTGPPAAGARAPMRPTGIVPAPPVDLASLSPKTETWPTGTVLYRGHESGPFGRRFNPHFGGPRRFSFFQDKTHKNVPVLYAGKTIDVAIAETLFHDLPIDVGATLLAVTYEKVSYSRIVSTRALRLAALHSGGLRRLGLENKQLIDTDAIEYEDTVKWAKALHSRDDLNLDGLTWMSRQFNSEVAVVLFGDRVSVGDLELDADEQDIPFSRGQGLGKLLIAADSAGIRVQPPATPFLS